MIKSADDYKQSESVAYEMIIQSWFNIVESEMTVEVLEPGVIYTASGETHIRLRFRDQAALIGFLRKIHQLGLKLIKVERLPTA
ncbi:MAG: hypothetical protein PWP51_670 [Clostridiales bacterium]|jgi:hypothetical protein|nr:hypothetical protein [Clostridiales bacterium]